GSIIFGHMGDRLGRKVTLIGALLTMGIATFIIGLLPTFYQIGLWAPAMLTIMRFCQGLGLGGEWSGRLCWSPKPPNQESALLRPCGHNWVLHLVSCWPTVSSSSRRWLSDTILPSTAITTSLLTGSGAYRSWRRSSW